ncbi:hypothetical protein H9P43_001589 [Blastocladiella emersonii ATCC 22665]|nr:hypothetical protein H9P43_001589 [Blastocladiella emersonii ATCC 22665]
MSTSGQLELHPMRGWTSGSESDSSDAEDDINAAANGDYKELKSLYPLYSHDGTKRRPMASLLHEDDPESHLRVESHADAHPLLSHAAAAHALPHPHKVPPPVLGILIGVLGPDLQNMLNIVLFIRLPMVIGVAGIGLSFVILLAAVACTLSTTISMSAIISNGVHAQGGAYMFISRTMGRELGGSMGLLFYLCTVTAIGVSLLGGGEVMREYVLRDFDLFGNPRNTVRLVGLVGVAFLTSLTLMRPLNANRAGGVLIAIVVLSVFLMLVGCLVLLGRADTVNQFPANFGSHFDAPDETGAIQRASMVTLFSSFFVCTTGIMVATNKIRRPAAMLPRGTLIAVGSSTLLYILAILLLGAVVSGDVLRTKAPSAGLVFATVSWPHPAVGYVGTVVATVGAALQSMMGAQRIFRAMARDNLFRSIRLNGRFRAMAITSTLASLIVLIGDLDTVVPIMTQIYLTVYASLNFSAALYGYTRPPTWRPTWQIYHWTTSLAGGILCIAVTITLSWVGALGIYAAVAALYLALHVRGAKVMWGGEGFAALSLQLAQRRLFAMQRWEESPSVWRPQLIAFLLPPELVDSSANRSSATNTSGTHSEGSAMMLASTWTQRDNECNRVAHLLSFLGQLRRAGGLTVVCRLLPHGADQSATSFAHIAQSAVVDDERSRLRAQLSEQGVDAFPEVVVCPSISAGITMSIQAAGVGMLRPNTAVLQVPDVSEMLSTGRVSTAAYAALQDYVTAVRNVTLLERVLILIKGMQQFPMVEEMDGTIDIYWIMYDGRIMMLLTFLLMQHPVWARCWRLRIYAIVESSRGSETLRRHLERRLEAMRIASEIHVLEMPPGTAARPGDEVYARALDTVMRVEAAQRYVAVTAAAAAAATSGITRPLPRTRTVSGATSTPSLAPTTVLTQLVEWSPERPATAPTGVRARTQSVHADLERRRFSPTPPPPPPVPALPRQPTPTFGHPVPDPVRVQYMVDSVRLNALIRKHSGGVASLVFCNAPVPNVENEQCPLDYLASLGILCSGLPRVCLVKGTGKEIV